MNLDRFFARTSVALASLLFVSAACDDPSPTPSTNDAGLDGTVVVPTRRIFVSDGTTAGSPGKVFVFDAETLAPVTTLTVGSGASEIRATPDGKLVWVVSSTDNSVALVDVATLVVTRRVVGVKPVHSFITPGHDQIWVGNDGSADVSVIDLASRDVVATILSGAGHHKMALATDANGTFSFAYVSNITDGSITPISAARVARTNVPGVGAAPHGMDYDAQTTHVFNCSGDLDANAAGSQPGIEVIATRDDASTLANEQHAIVGRIPLADGRCSYLHVEDGYAYVTIGGAGRLGRLRTATGVVETFDAGPSPDKFAIEGTTAFVANALAPTVTVVDLTGTAPSTTITTGNPVDPSHVPTSGHRDLLAFGGRLYVPNAFDGTVTVVDVESRTVVGTLAGMSHPTSVAIAGPGEGSTYPR